MYDSCSCECLADGDFETPEFLRESTYTLTRAKEKRCEGCGKMIRLGQRYTKVVGCNDRQVWIYFYHEQCLNLLKKMAHYEGVGYFYGCPINACMEQTILEYGDRKSPVIKEIINLSSQIMEFE